MRPHQYKLTIYLYLLSVFNWIGYLQNQISLQKTFEKTEIKHVLGDTLFILRLIYFLQVIIAKYIIFDTVIVQ